ncbi:MAG: TonB-dependent receptor [Hyphomonadaceae bacterium]
MTKRGTWLALLCASVSGLAITSAPPAFAQDQAASDEEEVVVTARRREENLQDVPVAVTAFSADALDAAGAQDLTAISQSTPNITLENSRATNSTLTAFIRGVGQQDPVAGFEQGVGIYLDDVYLNRPQGAVLDVYDLDRIEVLRGPQGTLYGRNTIGGAVKYVTRRLDRDDPTLRARFAYGSYNQMDVVLSGTTPLSDTFRVGGAVAGFVRDGFGDNLTTGAENYNKGVFAARVSAEWEPTPEFLVRVSADHIEDDSEPRQGHRLLPTLSAAQPFLLDGDYDTTSGVTNFAPFGHNRVVATGGQVMIDWLPAENWTLRSITAFRQDDTDSLIDFDSTPAPGFDGWVVYSNEQFSQELQAIYEGDRFSFVGGAYYLDANAFNAFDILFTSFVQFTLGDVDTQTWAVFGEGTLDFAEDWSLTIGGRYTEDERTSRVVRQFFFGQTRSPQFGGPGAIGTTEPVPTFRGSRTDTAFTPRVILAWEPNSDLNLYASYSQGFKGGGFDPRGNFANADVREGFLPEFVDSYELGAKFSLFGGRLRVNSDVFFAEYTDVQIPGSIVIPGPPISFVGTVTNAGAAEMTGVEFESTMRFTDALSGALSFGYIDAEYTEFIVGGVDVSNQRDVQNTPDWTGNASLTYSVPLTIGPTPGMISFTGSAAYRGDTQQFEVAIPLLDQPAYWLYDAAVYWTSDNDRWRIGLYGRNLSDERYITSGYNFPGAATDNSVLAFYGNPQTFTASVELRF